MGTAIVIGKMLSKISWKMKKNVESEERDKNFHAFVHRKWMSKGCLACDCRVLHCILRFLEGKCDFLKRGIDWISLGFSLCLYGASLVAQTVKCLPSMWETQV